MSPQLSDDILRIKSGLPSNDFRLLSSIYFLRFATALATRLRVSCAIGVAMKSDE